MLLEILKNDFSVCSLRDFSQVCFSRDFVFTAKTDEEFSLVCETGDVPADALKREDGWRAFRVAGVLDFSLIGILAKISSLLAVEKISVFVVSTYNTDYVFVKSESLGAALDALSRGGFELQK